MRLTPVLPLLALALAACEDSVVACDQPGNLRASAQLAPGTGPRRLSEVAPVAVRVTVVDSVTGTNLSAGATGSYVIGTLADSLRHDFNSLLVAYGPSGRYTLVVQHAGYAAWGRDDVHVAADQCGLETLELTARMQRLPGQP